jgi:ketosteroid isomerase-like protein
MKGNFKVMCMVVVFFLLVSSLMVSGAEGMLKKKVQAMHDKITKSYFGGKTMARGTEAQWVDIYTEDVISMPSFQKARKGKKALRDHQDTYWKDYNFHHMKFTPEDVWSCGKMVYDRGSFEILLTKKGETEKTNVTGNYFIIWEKYGGDTLKIKFEIWNIDHPMNIE